MLEGNAYKCSKKTDETCDSICKEIEESTRTRLKIRRIRCMLRAMVTRPLLFLCVFVPTLIVGIYWHHLKITYFFRPLWESPPKPFNMLPHYYYENSSMKELCELHGWQARQAPRRVFDAVPFSNELDMLEIRWKELYPFVTKFVILESNSTFTGLRKPLHFANNKDRFAFAEGKYHYGMYEGRNVPGAHPFVEEAFQRVALDRLLRNSGIEDGDLLIMSDADEIPSAHTINLLRWCDGVPPITHLQLREYLYSYEFFQGYGSWRASVHQYRAGKTKYAHYRQSDELLAESGWHCSFCFRYITDFLFKMSAYSHNDRVKHSYFLEPARIQHLICEGSDLFDMLPEEYTFKQMIAKMGPIPHSYSAVHLPSHVLQNADTFRFLLPGNCLRHSA